MSWDGKVIIKVNSKRNKEFAVNVRIPGWALDIPTPGDLYRFLDKNEEAVKLKVNDQLIDLNLNKGFTVIHRAWLPGDIIELDLPMPVRRVLAHEKVEDDRNKVALSRGPLVYCAEWIDNDMKVFDLIIPDNVELKTEYVRMIKLRRNNIG